MNQEYDVSYIWESINDFWKMFSDSPILEQLWRGYAFIVNNLYYQLYQLNLSKCIHTIRHNWISDWEALILDSTTRVENNPPKYTGFPYAYSLPYGVKDVTAAWDSPRETTNLPPYTILLPDNTLKLPDGSIRYIQDSMYLPQDVIIDSANNILIFPTGIAVDTKKFVAGTDFVVDVENKVIHFKEEPYPLIWAHLAIRNLEEIYDNFGCLIKYYKPDSFKYLREVQGLWFAYWNGAAINNIVKGITILRDYPFALDAGFVSKIDYTNSKITINTTDYQIPSSQIITVTEGDYVEQFTPLTSAVGVYDYINFPNWWRDYLGLLDGSSQSLDYECLFDGPIALPTGHFDHGDFDEFYTQKCIEAAFLQYFTFLVKIDQNVWFRSKADIDVVKAFLEAIKPAYTHYIFECEITFTDTMENIEDTRMHFSPWTFAPRDIPCDFHHFDDYMHPKFDDGAKFDFDKERDYLIVSVYGSPQKFYDNIAIGFVFDDPAAPKFDGELHFDSNPFNDSLEISITPRNLILEDGVNVSDSLDIRSQ